MKTNYRLFGPTTNLRESAETYPSKKDIIGSYSAQAYITVMGLVASGLFGTDSFERLQTATSTQDIALGALEMAVAGAIAYGSTFGLAPYHRRNRKKIDSELPYNFKMH